MYSASENSENFQRLLNLEPRTTTATVGARNTGGSGKSWQFNMPEIVEDDQLLPIPNGFYCFLSTLLRKSFMKRLDFQGVKTEMVKQNTTAIPHDFV